MGKLTYQTLRENVVDVIRMKIFNHELAPGMRIIEQDISDELGVSRGRSGEALRQLEQEGLVEYEKCGVFGEKYHPGGHLRDLSEGHPMRFWQ